MAAQFDEEREQHDAVEPFKVEVVKVDTDEILFQATSY